MPALAEHVDQLAQGVLGLGDRQPVARDDDHPVGVAEQDRDVLGAGRAHRPVGGLAGAERRAALERAEQDVGDRAAHRRGHQLGQERAGRADQGAGDQQHGVAEHVAAGRDGQAGEGVEQRDHDRYVGAADRQHQQHAEQQADQREHDPDPHAPGWSTSDDGQRRARRRAPSAERDRQAGEDHRPGGHQLLQLGERDQRAGEATPSRPGS